MAQKSKGAWSLMLAANGFLFCGMSLVILREGISMREGVMLTVVVLLALLTFLLIDRAKPRPNLLLFPTALMLSYIGIVEIARLNHDLLASQLKWLIIGEILMIFMLRSVRLLQRLTSYQYVLGLSCIIVLSLAIFFGTEIGGSRNWLIIGSFRMQPSEFGKILLVLFLAAYLADHRAELTEKNVGTKVGGLFYLPPLKFIAPLIAVWSVAIVMFVLQKDLGSALMFFGIAVIMTYMATRNLPYLGIALTFFALATIVSYYLFGHVKTRFDVWLNPWEDMNGTGYQIVQSLFAFKAGGVWGTGFGEGYPELIPEVHTDFVYAAIAEEMGLVGSLSVLLLSVIIFWAGIRIANTMRSDGEVLMCAGLAVVFMLQSFIIIAGVAKFIPLTGITLPFVSYGGSSMVSSFIMLGMLLSLSRKRRSI